DAKAFFGFHFQQALQHRACSTITAKNEIAALEQRARVRQRQRLEHIAQVGHADQISSADVYAAQQSNVNRHGGGPACACPGITSPCSQSVHCICDSAGGRFAGV